MLKPMTNHYDIHNILKLGIEDHGPGKKLGSILDSYRIQNPDEDSINLILCRRKEQVPIHLDGFYSAHYKGIPWRMAIDCCHSNRVRHIYFYATCFVTFLILRIVLIPLLRSILITMGGFNILGSAFYYQDRTYLIFGRPGTGKTRMALQALDNGASFIGDNELLFLRDYEICALFNELELRWNTAKGTLFWHELKVEKKLLLFLYEMISLLSLRNISFNLSLTPTYLGIKNREKQRCQNLVVIHLTDETAARKSTLDSFIDAVVEYEKWYQKVFGSLLAKYIEINLSQLRNNMSAFFSNSSIWLMPKDTDIESILIIS